MSTIQWRPEVNALTVPQSYKMRFVPHDVIGTDELAAEIAAENPVYNQGLAKSMIIAIMRKIQQNLIKGNQVVIEDAFSFSIGFTARLDAPDSPLPDIEEMLYVQIHALAAFEKEIHHQAQLERLATTERAPVINSAEDTRLKLNDVLCNDGIVQLTGTNLFAQNAQRGWECVLAGTRSGRAAQTRLGPVSATSIVFAPEIPAQEAPWNNEYTVSVATRYTEKGTLRTSTYRRRLRTPLTVPLAGHPHPPETGILTGNAAAPLVSVINGAASADERLRIQAVFDPRAGHLLCSLADMHEGGTVGATVIITANGEHTVQGFTGSAVSSLTIRVNEYSGLLELVRGSYTGRLVDVLDVQAAQG
jgi:hypothetical protein